MKKLGKIIIFIGIFLVIFIIVSKVLRIQRNPITEFYKEPKNSLDVIYIGGSNAYAHFNTTLAYNEHGFTTGMLSADALPLAATKYLIKESLKYQKPKVYVIDIARITEYFSMIDEGEIRRVTDALKNSQNRTDCINELLSYTSVPKSEYINYYLSFFTYHEVWKDKNALRANLLNRMELYKGYLFNIDVAQKRKQTPNVWTDEEKVLHGDTINTLNDLFKYIKDNNLNVIFVVPKRVFGEVELPLINYGVKYIKENGFEVINFNTSDDFQVDFDTDLYNFAHLNTYGATKYTLYFSRYLKENYDLEDHRGDSKYKSWDMAYEKFKHDYRETTGDNFEDLVREYKEMGY